MTISEILYKMETDLILNTLRHLDKGNIASAKWGVRKLSELGVLNKQNARIIKNAQEKVIPLIREELRKSQLKIADTVDLEMKDLSIVSQLQEGADQALKNTLLAFENKAIDSISATGSTMLSSLSKTYEEAITRVIQEGVITGESIRASISKTAKVFKDQGVSALIDKRDAKWSIEAYSQMVIRSNNRQITTQTQLDKFNEYDVNLVEISSHLGARPNCEPYQGRIFMLEGSSEKYDNLYSDTSYGEIDGLFGINCGHRMFPYKEGTKKTFNPYPKKANDKAYELSQEQRKLERKIRDSKRGVQLAEQSKDVEQMRLAKSQLKQDRIKMKEFVEKSGRTARPDRTRIY